MRTVELQREEATSHLRLLRPLTPINRSNAAAAARQAGRS